MTWTKKDDGDGPKWISGIYKVVRYEQDRQQHLSVHYRAYYIRKGDKHWGWYVDAETPAYPSLKAAQAACANHQKEQDVQAETR